MFETGSAIRTCLFSYSSNLIVYSTDLAMGSKCEIVLYDVRDLESPVRQVVSCPLTSTEHLQSASSAVCWTVRTAQMHVE